MKKALLVFDKFKDALSAAEICDAAAQGLRDRDGLFSVDLAPLSDGGEGFAEILTRAAGGELHGISVCGPRFNEVKASYGTVRLENLAPAVRQLCGFPDSGRLAVVEMAQASGLALLPPAERDPMVTTTFGTGEILLRAAREGADALLLGIGGSATHDIGLGALTALGLEPVLDGEDSAALPDSPRDLCLPRFWRRIGGFSVDGMIGLPPIRVACDVENPLLGKNGAAFVFAPQKGASEDSLPSLDEATGRMARLLCRAFGRPDSLVDEPGAGAAGGLGFGLRVGCGAEWVGGFELVADWLNLRERVRGADLVLTGEGRFDDASLSGKGPGRVVREAVEAGKPVLVFAGSVQLSAESEAALKRDGVRVVPVTPSGMPLPEALPRTGELLRDAVREKVESAEWHG